MLWHIDIWLMTDDWWHIYDSSPNPVHTHFQIFSKKSFIFHQLIILNYLTSSNIPQFGLNNEFRILESWFLGFKLSFFLRSQAFTMGMRTSLALLAKCLPRNCSHYLQNTSGSFSLKKPMYMMEESKFINWKTETFNVRLTSSADWLLCNSKNIVVESQTELSQSVSIFAGFHKFSPSPWSVSDLARKYVMNLEFCSEGRRSIMVWGKR